MTDDDFQPLRPRPMSATELALTEQWRLEIAQQRLELARLWRHCRYVEPSHAKEACLRRVFFILNIRIEDLEKVCPPDGQRP